MGDCPIKLSRYNPGSDHFKFVSSKLVENPFIHSYQKYNSILSYRQPTGLSVDEVLAALRGRRFTCAGAIVTALQPGVDIANLVLHRKTCDEDIREYGAIAAKKAVLESTWGLKELGSTEVHAALEPRSAEIGNGANESVKHDMSNADTRSRGTKQGGLS